MTFRNSINEKIILPLSDLVVGHDMKNQLSFLEESQWWSKNKLFEFQSQRLKLLIDEIYCTVPYYREIMKNKNLNPSSIKTIEDLNKLPILTKKKFKKNFPNKIKSTNWKKIKHIKKNSSGSTGKPIQYLMTRLGYSLQKATNIRGWYWFGYRLGDKLIKISQNERNSFEKKIQDKLNNTIIFSSSYKEEEIDRFINIIDRFNPSYLRSYPDPLQFISIALKKRNIKIDRINAINTTGNILFPEIRELVQNQFNCDIYDSYSCEGGPNFFECHTGECYHISMEHGICEILDDNMKEVGPGEIGKLYTTDLWNNITPFIRYESGDLIKKSDKECSCGRKLIGIDKIIGRDNDVIITPLGQLLIAQTFTVYFKYIDSIIQFQIYQEDMNNLEIRLKVNKQIFNKSIEREIVNYWETYVEKSMSISTSIVDDIPVVKSGKRRFLIRNKKIDLTF